MSNRGAAGPPPVQSRALTTQEAHANAAQQNYLTIVDTLKGNSGAEAKAIRAMLGGDKKLTDMFLSTAFSLLASDNDLLYQCTPMSIVESIKKAASLGLTPMTDEAAIVNYSGTATLLPMYKGYLKRIRNSGQVRAVDAAMVYTEDDFDYGTDQNGWWHRHHPAKVLRNEKGEKLTSRGAYMGAFAFAVMNNGYVYGRYMGVDELNKIRDEHGKTFTSTGKPLPWTTDYVEMCLKTVIRNLQKMLPQEAVGREFLELERSNDEQMEKITAQVAIVNEGLDDVRQLALRAVGQLPPGESSSDAPGADEKSGSDTGAADTDEGGSGTAPVPQGPKPDAGGPGATALDPGADPNVAAAMALSEEQEQLRRIRS